MNSSVQPQTPWQELEVPGEPGVYYCARHKNVQTRLRCGKCEKPICPKCTQYGPTGARCRDCLSLKSSHMYQVTLVGGLAAFALSLVAGLLGGYLVGMLGSFSLFALLYAPAIGPALGKLIVRASGGKTGTKLAVIASVGFAVGAIGLSVGMAVPLLLSGSPVAYNEAMELLRQPFLYVMTMIAAASLWVFLK